MAHPHRIVAIDVADDPGAWAAAGFTVADGATVVGQTTIRLLGTDGDGGRGIVGWTLAAIDLDGDRLDGLPTAVAASAPPPPATTTHPNGATGIDHVVVMTPDLDRTVAAVEATGPRLRRIRATDLGGRPARQAFFRFGPTVLEVVGGDQSDGDGPATWFGLTVDVEDLDRTAVLLGERLGPIKGAVQPGRRIATVRTRPLGVSVALAAMDDHGGR